MQQRKRASVEGMDPKDVKVYFAGAECVGAPAAVSYHPQAIDCHEWQPFCAYMFGDIVSWNGDLYRCAESGTTGDVGPVVVGENPDGLRGTARFERGTVTPHGWLSEAPQRRGA